MASESKGEFFGFENEEAEIVREQRAEQSNDESDISLNSTDSEESSASHGEEIVEEVWSTDDSPVQVQEFTELTGATSRIAEDGTARLLSADVFREFIQNSSNRDQPKCRAVDPNEARSALVCHNM